MKGSASPYVAIGLSKIISQTVATNCCGDSSWLDLVPIRLRMELLAVLNANLSVA